MRGSRKDMAELIRRAEKLGCSVRRTGTGHYRLTKDGVSVTVSGSTGIGRGVTKARNDLRRYLGLEL